MTFSKSILQELTLGNRLCVRRSITAIIGVGGAKIDSCPQWVLSPGAATCPTQLSIWWGHVSTDMSGSEMCHFWIDVVKKQTYFLYLLSSCLWASSWCPGWLWSSVLDMAELLKPTFLKNCRAGTPPLPTPSRLHIYPCTQNRSTRFIICEINWHKQNVLSHWDFWVYLLQQLRSL